VQSSAKIEATAPWISAGSAEQGAVGSRSRPNASREPRGQSGNADHRRALDGAATGRTVQ